MKIKKVNELNELNEKKSSTYYDFLDLLNKEKYSILSKATKSEIIVYVNKISEEAFKNGKNSK